MLDAKSLGIVLVAFAVAAFLLRIVAARSSQHRRVATVGTFVLLGILVLLVALLLWSMVDAYTRGLPQ